MGKIEGGEERFLKNRFSPPFHNIYSALGYINFIIQMISISYTGLKILRF